RLEPAPVTLRFQPCHLTLMRSRPPRQARCRTLPWLTDQRRPLITAPAAFRPPVPDNSNGLQVQPSAGALLTLSQLVDLIERSRVSTALERRCPSWWSPLSLVSYRFQ